MRGPERLQQAVENRLRLVVRIAVDRALSHIYRGGDIAIIFKRSFGNADPGQVLRTLYLISGLPD